MKNVFPAFLVALVVLTGCRVESPVTDDETASLNAAFDQLRSDYLSDYWQHHPIEAASAGMAAFHDRLPAMTAADIAHQMDQIKASLSELEALPVEEIRDPTRQNEWHRLRSHARERLLDLGELKQWQRDPGLYVPTTAFEVLLDPATGSANDRAGWLLARLHQLPVLLQTGRANLNDPPQRFTLEAIQRANHLQERLEQALPGLAAATIELEHELIVAGDLATAELRAFSDHLRAQVLPNSTESAAIGRDLYQRYLIEVHQINFPPEALIASAKQEFAGIEREMAALMADFDSTMTWAELRDSRANHPDWKQSDQSDLIKRLERLADELLQSARVMLDARIHIEQISVDEARHFLSDHLHMAHDQTASEVRWILDHPGRVYGKTAAGSRRISSRLMAVAPYSISVDERREEY